MLKFFKYLLLLFGPFFLFITAFGRGHHWEYCEALLFQGVKDSPAFNLEIQMTSVTWVS